MADTVVDLFAKHLAGLDDAGRSRAFAQVKMLAANQIPDEAFEPEVTSLRDYLAKDIPIPPSLVWPTIAVRGEITTTLGRAGKGKTTMNLNRIFAWAAGRAMFPGWEDPDGNEYLKPENPLKTLIAENEGNAGMFHQKVGILLNNGPLEKDEREQCLDNLSIFGNGGYSGLKLDDDAGVDRLRRAVEKAEPDIVFIEPFRQLWSGEENSSTDMAKVVDNMLAMATEFDCAFILSHHERKSGPGEDGEKMSAGRGSTVLEGVVAVMENFESVTDNKYREMTWSKARYLPPPHPVRMEWSRNSGWYEWVPTSQLADHIMTVVRDSDEPMNMTGIAEETQETKKKLRPIIDSLVKDGRLKKMQAISDGNGSTGPRFRVPTSEGDTDGLGF